VTLQGQLRTSACGARPARWKFLARIEAGRSAAWSSTLRCSPTCRASISTIKDMEDYAAARRSSSIGRLKHAIVNLTTALVSSLPVDHRSRVNVLGLRAGKARSAGHRADLSRASQAGDHHTLGAAD